MKKIYTAPQITAVKFETEDVIAISVLSAVRAYTPGEKVDAVDFNDLRN